MTWRLNKTNSGVVNYERTCRCCGGTGVETAPWGNCCTSREDMELIEHPGNVNKDTYLFKQLYRCNVCGCVWLIFTEVTDDSLDVPAPILIGKEIPSLDWKPPDKY